MAITEVEELAVIELGGGNCIRIVVNDQSGRKVVDVRRWYLDDEEELRPTGKGISIPAKHVEAVAGVIADAANHPQISESSAAPAKKAAATKKAAPAKRAAKRAPARKR